MVGAVALGIERTIGYLWTVVGMARNSFWPLTTIARHLQSLTDDLDRSVRPLTTQATAAVEFLKARGAIVEDAATTLTKRLVEAQDGIDKLKFRHGEVRLCVGMFGSLRLCSRPPSWRPVVHPPPRARPSGLTRRRLSPRP